MTKKEKLYNEWMAIKKQIAECKGETFTKVECNLTAKELEYRVEDAKMALARAQKMKKINDFYATEEGKKYEAIRRTRLDEIKQERESLFKATEALLRGYVQSFLGEEFDINFGARNCEIGLVEKRFDNGNISFYFGHSFNVYYEISMWRDREGEFEFKINFGTMGGFDPQVDTTYAKYVTALGKFVGSHIFRGLCEDYARKYSLLQHWQWQMKRELENPEI